MMLLKPTNAQLKNWMDLADAKTRKGENRFLAEGAKVVTELLRSSWHTSALLILSGREERFSGIAGRVAGKVDIYSLNEKQWRRLSQDRNPEGVMAVASVPAMPAVKDLPAIRDSRLLLLHEINNPNNLGAILRAADWFGFRTVLLSAGSVDYTHPKVVRTAMGSLFRLKLIGDLDFAVVLRDLGRSFLRAGSDVRSGVAPHACAGRIALLLGSESHGLPEELLALTDERWYIACAGEAESLSLPQAAAVMMYACATPS